MKNEEALAIYGELYADEYVRLIAEASPEAKQQALIAALKRRGITASPPTLPLTPDDRHKCSLCDAAFKWPSQLDRHVKLAHSGGEESPKSEAPKSEAPKVEKVPATEAEDEQAKKKKYTRAHDFAPTGTVKEYTQNLVGKIFDHATVAYHKGHDDWVLKTGRYYTVNVYGFCRALNCDPKYGLFCLMFLRRFGKKIIRRIRLGSNGRGGCSAVAVLSTEFVSGSESDYTQHLEALRADLEAAEWEWDSNGKPPNFSVVVKCAKKLSSPRVYKKKNSKASRFLTKPESKPDPDPEPEEDPQPPPHMTPQSRLKYQQIRQKLATLRRGGPGPAAPGEPIA